MENMSLGDYLSQKCSCGCGSTATMTHNRARGYFANIDCIRKTVPDAKFEDTFPMND